MLSKIFYFERFNATNFIQLFLLLCATRPKDFISLLRLFIACVYILMQLAKSSNTVQVISNLYTSGEKTFFHIPEDLHDISSRF